MRFYRQVPRPRRARRTVVEQQAVDANAAITQAMKEWKANHDRMKSCPRPHDFELVGQVAKIRKFRCRKCQCIASGEQYDWYRAGLEDARLEESRSAVGGTSAGVHNGK